MIDTHTHLYISDSFPDGGTQTVSRALAAGVSHMIFPNVDLCSVAPLLKLHSLFPDNTSVAKGLHPTEVTSDWKENLMEICNRFADASGAKCVAMGEIGLDFYWSREFESLQIKAFEYQLRIAADEDLPVIIHSRNALDRTLEVTASMGKDAPELLFHSFTAGPREAELILENHPEALFGFNGVATFKNAGEVREALKLVGIEHIVLETDAPWLAPVPHRGKTNESSFIPHILQCVAETLSVSLNEAESATDANACSFFNLTDLNI